jgi:hypothetical protein
MDYRRHKERYSRKAHQRYLKYKNKYLEHQKKRYYNHRGILEPEMYNDILKEFPNAKRWTVIPDFYDATRGLWIELKRASKVKDTTGNMRYISKYFPELFFNKNKGHGREAEIIDDQIDSYPRPLLVIVKDYKTGQELTRRYFQLQTEKS